MLPPVVVDYRDDDDGRDGLRSSAGGSSPVGSAGAGAPCREDAQCNDCDPCTLDACTTHVCQGGGPRDGFGCDPDENDCEGRCDGGADIECPNGTCDFVTNQCVGGSNPGGACTPDSCFSDSGCCGDEATGGSIPHGACVLFPCVALTPPAGGGGQCMSALIPPTLFVPGSECDDGLECNGGETCSAGACVPGMPLCSPGSDTVCDEAADACVPYCVDDAECDTDGSECTKDICDARTCLGGFRDGLPCRSTGDAAFGCDEPPIGDGGPNDGACSGGGAGECRRDTPLCGPGASACTPGFCIDPTPGGASTHGDPCNAGQPLDPQCGAGACSCPKGRCCVGDGTTCQTLTFEGCQSAGGVWFATADACGVIGQTQVLNTCPLYGVGIAPQATPTTAVGPIQTANPGSCPNTLFSAGDDYATAGATGGYVDVEIVRFIASVQVQSRLTIEFWDTNRSPPVFVEDTFFDGSPGPGGPAIRTLVFDPPLTVPDTGVMALVNADRFTPRGASSFLAMEAAPIVGTSSPTDIWLNDTLVSGGVLGVCDGGARDGGWCDGGTLGSCPGGTCDQSIPDTLGFEIVATTGSDPSGACCDSATGTCTLELPWICEDDGGVFQGAGTKCRACANNPFAACVDSFDCPACTGDPLTEGFPCDPGGTHAECGKGFCVGTATCAPVPPACAVQGCCATTTIGTIPVCSAFSDNPGFHCPNGNTDCDGPGGFCGDTVEVRQGDCVAIRGGCSTLVDGKSVPCAQDADCPTPGDTCLNNACPTGTGTGSAGFGTSCEPSQCVQPQFEDCPGGSCLGSVCSGGGRDGLACLKHSGGDNCFDAPVHNIPVPPLASPPVALTTTITGNNAEATYDDWNDGRCAGGANDTLPCDPNAVDQEMECPGGACVRLCGSGIFNPDGATADPGWWEAFRITECANVRVGLCGSPLVVQPAWAFLSVDCPCDTFLGNEGVDPPVGTGLGGEGSERGDPFCSDSDNLWQTFRNLPPGTYYYPILSEPNGTCAAPAADSDAPGCTYQLQITTGACTEAACCADAECVGGEDAGLPCDAGGLVACSDGACIGGFCDAGILIGHACVDGVSVDQCPGGVCTAGPVCTQTNELRCDAAGGFFVGELNLPPSRCAGGPYLGNACDDDADCPKSFCVQVAGTVTCTAGELGVCEFGACCNGPGACGNADTPGGELDLFDRALCDIETQGTGTFVAGSRCNYPDPPCPVCTAAETPGNCQEATGATIWSIDPNSVFRLSASHRAGPVVDDFIANVPEIGQFCFSPCFLQTGLNAGGIPVEIGECSDPQGPVPPPPDQIFVRFFDDGANDANPLTRPGFPGDPLPGSPTGSEPVEIAAKRWQGFPSRCWDYAVVFDPPIQGFVQGRRYWVEFSGKGSRDENGDGCELFILGSLEGNGWAFRDNDAFGDESSGQRTWDINDAWLQFESGEPQEFAFCIEGGFTVPPTMTGACCECDGTCTDGAAPTDCLSGLDEQNNPVGDTIGHYFPLQTCEEITCENVAAAGGCPGAPGDAGEDCDNPICIGPPGAVCADGGPPEMDFSLFETTRISASTLCSTTDGPETYPLCGSNTSQVVGQDQWFEVHAPATGKFQCDTCGSRLDAVTAIYSNGTSTCPHDPVGGGSCPPDESTLDFCADIDCSAFFGQPSATAFATDTCRGGSNDGQPCPLGDADCPDGACEGECFLVRIGGDQGDAGPYQLEMNLFPTTCPDSSPPAPDQVGGETLTMNRALAFSAGDPGLRQAIRVVIDSVSSPANEYLVGSTWWVQPPAAYGEVASNPAPIVGVKNFRAATLGCEPFFMDWNGFCLSNQCEGGLRDGSCENNTCIGGPNEGQACTGEEQCPGEPCTQTEDCGGGIIDVFGEMIVAGASYTVSVAGADCDLNDEATFSSSALTMTTSAYGDVAGICSGSGCAAPDGAPVAVADALAILAKFSGSSGSMRKIRADLEPSLLDFQINVTDVLQALRGFAGLDYPYLSCRPTSTSGQICFGGPIDLQPCATDLDCRIARCPPAARPGDAARVQSRGSYGGQIQTARTTNADRISPLSSVKE